MQLPGNSLADKLQLILMITAISMVAATRFLPAVSPIAGICGDSNPHFWQDSLEPEWILGPCPLNIVTLCLTMNFCFILLRERHGGSMPLFQLPPAKLASKRVKGAALVLDIQKQPNIWWNLESFPKCKGKNSVFHLLSRGNTSFSPALSFSFL